MIKDAKLFGKINIIDLFIVVALLGAGVFGVYQFTAGRGVSAVITATPTQTYTISFFTEEIENFSANVINIGDSVFHHGPDISLGTVTDIRIEDAIIWNADAEGNTVQSNKEGFSSVELTARLDAVPSDHGIVIAGNRYGIGHSLAIRAGKATIFVRISGLEIVNR
ncbi:MAG: DUF4330 domain-containing protein [Clostridiales bacterium]|jgi:hypothetical protein|nr:DUF4330 domain-containing protein [Clostridiales bacterium]